MPITKINMPSHLNPTVLDTAALSGQQHSHNFTIDELISYLLKPRFDEDLPAIAKAKFRAVLRHVDCYADEEARITIMQELVIRGKETARKRVQDGYDKLVKTDGEHENAHYEELKRMREVYEKKISSMEEEYKKSCKK